jgi:hypothetical protein
MTHDAIVAHLTQLGYDPNEIADIIDSLRGYDATSIPVILAHFPDADSFVEVLGADSCDDAWDDDNSCPGWDGYSRRCGCGNRRVYWAVDDDWAYAAAD